MDVFFKPFLLASSVFVGIILVFAYILSVIAS